MVSIDKASRVDLHVHTTCSDGIFTPEKVVEVAESLGLKAISVTDHDCVEGVQPAIDAAKDSALEVVPGIELSCSMEDREAHVLGYFIDHQDPELVDRLGRMKINRADRMKRMVACLREQGLDMSDDMVFDTSEDGTVGRLHLARVMALNGLVADEQEAFDRYIGDGKCCHVQHKRLDYKDAIKIILSAGGVPVLAHPGTMGADRDIAGYIEAGVRGLEAYHSKHYDSTAKRYLKMAERKGLIVTGGSDCHGHESGKSMIGNVDIGYEVVEALKEEAERIKARGKG